jgi:hypothetical protein
MLGLMEKRGNMGTNLHAPDRLITARILAIEGWPTIERCFNELLATLRPGQCGQSWAWFEVVLLQRIHGIRADVTRCAREHFRAIRGGSTTPQPDPDFARQLVDQVQRARGA